MIRKKINKLVSIYKSNGMTETVKQTLSSVLYRVYKKKYDLFTKGLGKRDNASVFSEIYRRNLWKSGESHSGLGSELAYTKNLIKLLPEVFDKFNIKTIIDAPCGDFNWMKHVPLKKDMNYIGLDIVQELVVDNQKKYGNNQYRFMTADISKDPLPKADILFCRDCLFHLSNKDIFNVLKNFVESDISWLMTSTHININKFKNTDINSGDFRLIDLFSEPFALPLDVDYRVLDFVAPFPEREMCVWNKSQIHSALEKMSKIILNYN